MTANDPLEARLKMIEESLATIRAELWSSTIKAKGHAGRSCVAATEAWERALGKVQQITKYRRNPADFDVRQLAMQTEGLTGSEIEQAFIEGLYDVFGREGCQHREWKNCRQKPEAQKRLRC